jgi:hypothetical protein
MNDQDVEGMSVVCQRFPRGHLFSKCRHTEPIPQRWVRYLLEDHRHGVVCKVDDSTGIALENIDKKKNMAF